MRVNGRVLQVAPGQTLLEFLNSQGFDVKRVAVELNGEIVPRTSFPSMGLGDADTLEVVQFVGGG